MMMLFISMPNVYFVPDNVISAAHLFLQIVCYCCIDIGGVYVCIMYRVLLKIILLMHRLFCNVLL
jgi:hypothetical protein